MQGGGGEGEGVAFAVQPPRKKNARLELAMLWATPSWHGAPAGSAAVATTRLREIAQRYRAEAKETKINCTNFTGGKYTFPEENDFYLHLVGLLLCAQGSPRSLALAEISHPQTPRFYVDLDLELRPPAASACPPEVLNATSHGTEGVVLDGACLVARVHQYVVELAGPERGLRAYLLEACGTCGLKGVYKPSFRLMYPDLVLHKRTALALLLEVQTRCVLAYGRDELLGNKLDKALDRAVYDEKRPMRLLYSDKARRPKCRTCKAVKARGPCLTGGCRTVWAGRPLRPLGVLEGLCLRKHGLSWPEFVLGCSTRYGLPLARWQDPPDVAARLAARGAGRGWAVRGSPSAAAPPDERVLWDLVYAPAHPSAPGVMPGVVVPAVAPARAGPVVATPDDSGVLPWGAPVPQRVRCSPELAQVAVASCGAEAPPQRVLYLLVLPYLGQRDGPELLDWAKAKVSQPGPDGLARWFGVQGIRGSCACPFKSASLGLYKHSTNLISVTVGTSCLHFRCFDADCQAISQHYRIVLPDWARPRLLGLLRE